MAYFLFTKAAFDDTPIDVFNHGDMKRDFTYIDDIISGVVLVIDNPAKPNIEWDDKLVDPATSSAPYRIYNIGNNAPVKLGDFIRAIEESTGKIIKKNMLPMQAGDVTATYADVADLVADLNYRPHTDLQYGVDRFVHWYRKFYAV